MMNFILFLDKIQFIHVKTFCFNDEYTTVFESEKLSGLRIFIKEDENFIQVSSEYKNHKLLSTYFKKVQDVEDGSLYEDYSSFINDSLKKINLLIKYQEIN